MTHPCSFCPPSDVPTPATVELRMLARRTDEPASADIGRSLVWPHVESPVTVRVCAAHREAARLAARTVMREIALGEAVDHRTVKE